MEDVDDCEDAPKDSKMVVCLKCREKFKSKNPKTNRICESCRTVNFKIRAINFDIVKNTLD